MRLTVPRQPAWNTPTARLRIDEDGRQTICRLNAEQHSWSRRDQPIAGELRCWRRIDAVDDVGVDLAERNGRGRLGPAAERTQKCKAIALDCGLRVIFSEAEVEGGPSVGA